jgi:hypothetical protein
MAASIRITSEMTSGRAAGGGIVGIHRRMRGTWAMRMAAIGLGLAGWGCGGGGAPFADDELRPVTGRVLVAGKPAAGVEVRLHPLNQAAGPGVATPRATTDRNGNFKLRADDAREGAPDGQYHVTLSWPSGSGGADRLGGVYSEPGGSGLTAVIDAGTTALPPFDVKVGRRGPG